MADLIARESVLNALLKASIGGSITDRINAIPDVNRWIPVEDALPDGIQMVLITWVNHNPEDCYSHIKDKPFTGAAHYFNGKWWWESSCCEDYLAEYGRSDVDAMDDAIEVLAWMPLPPAYEQEKEG